MLLLSQWQQAFFVRAWSVLSRFGIFFLLLLNRNSDGPEYSSTSGDFSHSSLEFDCPRNIVQLNFEWQKWFEDIIW